MINLKDLNKIKDLISKEYFNGSLTPWIIAYSGGKDNALLLNLTLDEITKKNHNLIKRKIFIVSNDTLVESPLIKNLYMTQLIKLIIFVN